MARFEVITGPERRRRWSEEQKRAIVAESFAPGAVVTEVARRADVSPGQIYRWRQELRAVSDGFAQVLIAPAERCAPRVTRPCAEPAIEVEFAGKAAGADTGLDAGGIGGGGRQGAVAAMIPVPVRRAGVAGGRAHRHAARHEQPGAAGPGGLGRDPHAGDLYVFRGKRGHLIKILWHDGIGMSLYAKRLERGRFIWPSPADGTVAITAAQLAYMLDGIDWRNPVRTWRPEAAG